jgi:hypothetical protein
MGIRVSVTWFPRSPEMLSIAQHGRFSDVRFARTSFFHLLSGRDSINALGSRARLCHRLQSSLLRATAAVSWDRSVAGMTTTWISGLRAKRAW